MKRYFCDSRYKIGFGKKWEAWLIDLLVLLVLGTALSFASVKINKTLPIYIETINTVNSKIEELNNLNKEANLLDFNEDGSQMSMEEMYEFWAKRSIKLSYENNKEYFKIIGYGNIEENEKMKDVETLSVDNDYPSYFYIKYLP